MASTPPGTPGRWRLPRWTVAIAPGVAALAVTCWGIRGPSLWWDETATVSAAVRSPAQLGRLLRHVDLVHGLYYAIMHVVVAAGGVGAFAVRLPSALAVAFAAVGLAVLGRELDSARAGLLGGLVYAVLPVVSLYGQTARSYALVSAVAVWTTLLFVRAARRPSAGRFTVYAAALVGLGLLHLFALLLVVAHGAALVALRARCRRRWLAAVVAAGAAITPFAVAAFGQRGQIDWIERPGLADIPVMFRGLYGSWQWLPLLACAIAGVARSRTLAAVAVPWIVLPPVVLFLVSQADPVFRVPYVLFCVPPVALAAGVGLARLRPVPRLLAAVLVVALAVPSQLALRRVDSRGQDLRTAAADLRSMRRPGDAVLYTPPFRRAFADAYPQALGGLDDVSLVRSPRAAGTWAGGEAREADLVRRLSRTGRVWLWRTTGNLSAASLADLARKQAALGAAGLTVAGRWRTKGVVLLLYRRLA